MKVLYYNELIINVDDDCPSYDRLIADGAEEIDIDIFGDYPHFATSDNTALVDDVWTFTFDSDTQDSIELAKNKIDVKSAIDALIQEEIDTCNESTGCSFDNADAFAKYAINDSSDKQAISLIFVEWIDSVWTACRACEALIASGDYDYPDTIADFITLAELPEIGEY